MAATITQNLPGGVAKTARPVDRPRGNSRDQEQSSQAFDVTLKRSVERQSKRREEVEPAESPATEGRRSEKSDRAGGKKDEPLEQQAGTDRPTSDQTEQPQSRTAADESQPSSAGESTVSDGSKKPATAEAVTPIAAPTAADAAVDPSVGLPASEVPVEQATLAEESPAADVAVSRTAADSVDVIGAQASPGTPPAGVLNGTNLPDGEAEAVDQGVAPITGQPTAPPEPAAGRQAGLGQQALVNGDDSTAGDDATESLNSIAAPEAKLDTPVQPTANADSSRQLNQAIASVPSGPQRADAAATPAPTAAPPAPQPFAEANHPQIASAIRGQLLPNGGSMQIRLDPPEMGALLVQVTLRNGVIDASFQTSNPEATQALSHSLTQLKHSLESQGVSVDKLQVSQAPRSERSETNQEQKNSQQQSGQQGFDWERHSDQQRKEMLKRMWAKLGAGDPLDLVA